MADISKIKLPDGTVYNIKDLDALTIEVYNAGKQVTTGNNTGEKFNDYTYNEANGNFSHAEGSETTASGSYSHTEGHGTIAASFYQHVQGKYNIEDSNSEYAFIIGNGTSNSARSNAFAVDWNGLVYVNNASTGVDVSSLATRLTAVETTIGNINSILEEVL